MRLWILSHLRDSPGGHFVFEAARRRGHEAERVSPFDFDLRFETGRPVLLRADGSGPARIPEVVLIRMGGSAPEEAYLVPRALELAGVPCINSIAASRTCRDKARSLSVLAAAGLPLPRTLLPTPEGPVGPSLDPLGGPPWVVKPIIGTKGMGVELVESREALEAVLQGYRELGLRVMVQEMIESSRGRDLRVLVLEGRARLAMQRIAAGDDFRSNLHQGGRGEAFALTPEISAVAEAAALAVGARIAGVDLLFGEDGPLVCEVNGSPGLRGIEAATGIEASAMVIEVLERAAARG